MTLSSASVELLVVNDHFSLAMFRTWIYQPLFFLSFFLHSVYLQTPKPTHWDYGREGPDTWPHTYDTCEGEAQSPIDIRTSRVKYDSSFPPLSLNGYNANMSTYTWNFTHNGHTIVAYPSPLARLSMSGGGLPEAFFLLQFHMHWGYNPFQGSEHTIDGRKYPLEVHFVHRAPVTNVLAVLGILFERQRDDNPYLNDLLSVVNRTVDSSVAIAQQIDLSRLFPKTPTPKFYRYNGSLTTPPCTEGVIWTILARPIPISDYQLRAFDDNQVPFNYRPTQKLHSRRVFVNFRAETEEGAEEEGGGEGGHHSSASSAYIGLMQIFLLVVFVLLIG